VPTDKDKGVVDPGSRRSTGSLQLEIGPLEAVLAEARRLMDGMVAANRMLGEARREAAHGWVRGLPQGEFVDIFESWIQAENQVVNQLEGFQRFIQDMMANWATSERALAFDSPSHFEMPDYLGTRLDLISRTFSTTLREAIQGLSLPSEAPALNYSELGVEAAQMTAASMQWGTAVGDRLDTTTVVQMLGVTRQALAKRTANGSLLGLPGHRTTWYPTWQFDRERQRLRPEVRELIMSFRRKLRKVDPLLIASWASTQQEDLDGVTPAQWLEDGGDSDKLLVAAARAASHLAQ
jgi:hypothetical protein